MIRQISRGKGPFWHPEDGFVNRYYAGIDANGVYAYLHTQQVFDIAQLHVFFEYGVTSDKVKMMRQEFELIKMQLKLSGVKMLASLKCGDTGRWSRVSRLFGFGVAQEIMIGDTRYNRIVMEV